MDETQDSNAQNLAKTEDSLEKSVEMENGLTLEIWNKSKVIAGDRWKVSVVARVEVPLAKAFEKIGEAFPDSLAQMRDLIGDFAVFEKKMDRFFIDEREKDELKRELVESLFETVLPYISKPKFAKRFLLAEYAKVDKRRRRFGANR